MKSHKQLNSFATQLVKSTLPKQSMLLAGLLGCFLLVVLVIRSQQNETYHNTVAQQAVSHIEQHQQLIVQQITNLAENDLVINSLIDVAQRADYLPLLFQSFRINDLDQFNMGLLDYRGQYIAGNNFDELTHTFFKQSLLQRVIDQSEQVKVINELGFFIAVPVMLNGFAEAAVVFHATNIADVIPNLDSDLFVLATVKGKSITFNQHRDNLHGKLQYTNSFDDYRVLTRQRYADAYQDIALLVTFMVALFGFAVFGSYLVTREAASRAQDILLGFSERLNVLSDGNLGSKPRAMPAIEELASIEHAFQSVLTKLTDVSASSNRLSVIFNGVREFLVLLNPDKQIRLSNYAFDEMSFNTEFDQAEVIELCNELVALEEQTGKQSYLERTYCRLESSEELCISWYKAIIKQDDKILGYVLVGQDISARKKAEEELLIKNAAIDKANTSIIISDIEDPRQPIIYANQAYTDLTEYPSNEVLGRNCNLLQGKNTEKDKVETIRQAIKNREPLEITLTNYKASGEPFLNQLSLSPVKDKHGRVKHYVGIQNDVTKQFEAEQLLVQAKQAAEESTRLKSDFLASMSHEIRTPINGIFGTLQLLNKTNLDTNQDKYLSLAIQSTRNLLTIINDILDFSKIEAGKLDIEKYELNIFELVSNSVDSFYALANQKNIELIQYEDLNDEHFILGDAVRIRQVMDNLIGNAIKFTEHGQVVVSVGWQPQTNGEYALFITVSDTGIGISDDKLDHIFEHFSQEDNSTTRRFGGSGLGLAICKQLCDLMGGDIQVQSEKGSGTQFKVIIPTIIVSKRVEAIQAESLSTPELKSECTILVVEDNELNRMIVCEQLKDYKLFTAENGEQALKLLNNKHSKIDVVLMDCQMPVMDGYTCSRAIRNGDATERYRHVPIIALTAHAMKGDREKCLEFGMNDYLTKPFTSEDLHSVVSHWYEKAKAGTVK